MSVIRPAIVRPWVTEKSTLLKDKQGVLSFEVSPAASKVEIRRAIEKPDAANHRRPGGRKPDRFLGKHRIVREAKPSALHPGVTELSFVSVNGRFLASSPADDEKLEVGVLVDQVPRVVLVAVVQIRVECGLFHESLSQVLAYLGFEKSPGGEAFQIIDEVLETHVARHGLLMP